MSTFSPGPGSVVLFSQVPAVHAGPQQVLVQWSCSPRYLQYTLDPTKIRKQDTTSTIQAVAHNVVGMPLAWTFVREKWSYIFEQ